MAQGIRPSQEKGVPLTAQMFASMGVPARRVHRAGDIAGSIQAWVASGITTLIEAVTGSM
jgi:hypothetical protein